MKVGSLVFATDQGLGILAKAFYDHGVVTDVCVIRHGRHPEHDEWYPGAPRIHNMNSDGQLNQLRGFIRSMDVMLYFETPFRWDLVAEVKRSVLMPMHECLHNLFHSTRFDLLLCPSLLDMQIDHPNKVFLPVPVEVPWRKRTRAEVFVHNAGHGGLRGRNGTRGLLEATQYVKSPFQLTVRTQANLNGLNRALVDPRVSFIGRTVPFDQLWTDGDVFVFPEKFNGLSLPLQEARAAGMLVMATDRFPMNTWLPEEPLIPVTGYSKARIGGAYREFDEAVIDSKDIAAKIDEWYGQDISEYSEQGRRWTEDNSWKKLGPKYKELLRSL